MIKPTAPNIAKYVNKKLREPTIIKGKEYPPSNNIAIYLPRLNKLTLKSLQTNYGFKTVKREFLGFVYFERY